MKITIPGTDIEYNPTLESTLLRVDEMKPDRVDDIKRAAKYAVFAKARKAYPNAKLIIRDLFVTDVGLTTWEDSAASSGWQNHVLVSKTIGDGRFIAITGMRMLTANDMDLPPILGLRWTVGGAVVALWDIHKAYTIMTDGLTIANITSFGPMPYACITESPIIISEGIVVTLDQYEEGAVMFVMPLEGYVCELEGKTIKA